MPGPSSPHTSPLVIGVSGHRNLDPACTGRVRAEIRALFERLKHSAGNTEIRVMIGMAEGADLLAAEAALDCGLAVDAVLPMALEDYAADFTPAGLALLHDTLRRPGVRRIELAKPCAPTPAERDAAYARLTDVLVRKSTLLVALWDGTYSDRPGGTADTLLAYLDARAARGRIGALRFIDERPGKSWGHQFVYWVSTSRSDGPPRDSPPVYLSGLGECLLHRHADMPNDFREQLRALDIYNRELAQLAASGQIGKPDSMIASLPTHLAAGDLATLVPIDEEYGKADSLAMHYQRHSDRLFRAFSYLAAFTGLLFLVYAKLHAGKFMLVAYVLCVLAGIGAFRFLGGRQWFARHLVYRALAETMRTKFFLRLSTADAQVNANDLIRLTGIDQFTGFSWITMILKNVEPFASPYEQPPIVPPEHLVATRKAWVEGQQSYFRAKVARMERSSQRLETLKGLLFGVLLVIAAILLVFGDELGFWRVGADTSYKDVLMFVMGLLPLLLGIWELYQNKMATRELLWQYRNQLTHFSRAQLRLAQTESIETPAQILADVGRNSLMESYLWTIHRYHREHEPPALS